MLLAITLILTVVSVVACHMIAKSRGGDAVFWGVMGLLFGPFAIPFAFRAKPKTRPLDESRS